MNAHSWRRRPTATVAALGALALLLLGAGCSNAATRTRTTDTKAPATLELGSQTLRRCAMAPLAYCGSLRVPLDYGAARQPTDRDCVPLVSGDGLEARS
jgi:hypothetical protein